jgi:dTDP-4-dehydrorhamnose reductase
VRVLVTGASGLLGGRLALLLARDHAVVAARHETPLPAGLDAVTFDLLSPASIAETVVQSQAEAVVHSAAFADADRCEADPALAHRANVVACEALARACRTHGVRLLALSTDLVFGGDAAPARETDDPQPILVYGRTKLDGERAVLDGCPGAAVVRVALVHGRGHGRRGTASESIAWQLAAGRTPRLFVDQFRTPVDAESVADLLQRLLASDAHGVFHAGGPERMSRHDLGLRVAASLGASPGQIVALRQDEAPQAAPRPRDVSLDCTRAHAVGWRPRPVAAGVALDRRGPDA